MEQTVSGQQLSLMPEVAANLGVQLSKPLELAVDNGEELGFFGTAGEFYMHETLVGNMIRQGGIVPDDKAPEYYNIEPGTQFNPYKYWNDNKEEFADMEQYLANRLFQGVYSEEMFRDRADRLRAEQKSRQLIANGSTLGSIAGGLLSFADVTTLVPGFGIIKKAETLGNVVKLGKVAKWSSGAVYYSGIQEMALHQTQDLRTLTESGYALGGAAVLGGGIGVFAHVRNPASTLNPKNPNFILRPENKVRMAIKNVSDSMANSVILQPVIKNGRKTYEAVLDSNVGQSVGAAARKVGDTAQLLKPGVVSAAKKPVQLVGQAGLAVAKKLAQLTPLGRTLTSRSNRTRELAELIFDRGGVLLEGDSKGIFNRSVEDEAGIIMSKFHMDVVLEFPARLEQLRMKLAELQGKIGSVAKEKAADLADDAIQFGRQTLRGPRGAMDERTESFSTDNGRLMEHEFEDLVDMAMRENITQEVIDNMIKRFGQKGYEMIRADAEEFAKFVHERNKLLEDELVELGMITEGQRLGKDYVAPQLWNARGIRANREDAYQFFIEVLAKRPPEEFLDEAYGITEETFAKLGKEDVTMVVGAESRVVTASEGVTIKREILEDWSGEVYRNGLIAAEARLELAQEAFEEARRQAVLAARDLRVSITDIKKASVDEAVKVVKNRILKQQQKKDISARLKARREKLAAELKKEEAEFNARMNQFHETGPEKARLNRSRSKDVKEAEALLDLAYKEGDPKDIKFAEENVTRADNELDRVADDALQTAVEKADTRPISNELIAKLKERIARIDKEIAKLDEQIKVADIKLARASAVIEDAVARRKEIQALTKEKRALAKESRTESRKAGREQKRARKALKKYEGKSPIHVYVQDLLDNLSQSSRPPMGLLDKTFFESGRVKTRKIKLTPEQHSRAVQLGILNGSLIENLSRGINDLAPRMALRRVLGHLGSNEEDILRAVEREIRDDYQVIMDQARKQGRTQAHLDRLERRMKRDIDDIQNGIKRVTGTLNSDVNYESLLSFGMTASKMLNYIRYGSGFTIASQTDLANVLLHSGYGTYSYRNLKAVNRIINNMSSPEIKRLAVSMEKLMHNSRDMRINNVDDMRNMAGIGDYNTKTHYVTSTIDRALSGMGRGTQYLSAMYWWNSRLKMLAMSEMQHNLVELIPKYSNLLKAASAGDKAAEKEIAELAAMGFGEEQIRRISAQMDKYPPVRVDDTWELQMHRWRETKEGRAAYDDVLVGLEHVANRSIMTPGKGDTPYFMSKPFYSMLMQFQTYGFVTVTRYMLPAFQRMASYGDMEAFMSLGLNLALGTSVVMAKDILRTGEIKDRDQSEWAYDIIDRSGLLAYTSPLLAEVMMRFGEQLPSRYARERNRLTMVLGPTGGLIQDAADLYDAGTTGDTERFGNTALKFLPLHVYGQMWNIATGGND
jgi:hypothetical protein